jgi:predicted phage tail protein
VRTLTLHGRLGEEFGGPYRLAVDTPAEAVHALAVQLPGFRAAVDAGTWRVTVGDLDLDETELRTGTDGDYAIRPVLTGAGGHGKSVGKIVLGTALTAAGFATGQPALIQMGIAIGLSGIAMLLAPAPVKEKATKDKSSFLFDGPVNSDQEGGVVPLVYGGPVLAGGSIISGSIVSETLVGWTGPVLGDPFLTTHTLTVGVNAASHINGFRTLKFGNLDPRNVSASAYVRELSYGTVENRLYFTVDVGNLSKGWLDHVRLYDDVADRFNQPGYLANYGTGSGYTQWYWDMAGNPMPKAGEELTLEIERTA